MLQDAQIVYVADDAKDAVFSIWLGLNMQGTKDEQRKLEGLSSHQLEINGGDICL